MSLIRPGMLGKAQPSTALALTAITFSASQVPDWKIQINSYLSEEANQVWATLIIFTRQQHYIFAKSICKMSTVIL